MLPVSTLERCREYSCDKFNIHACVCVCVYRPNVCTYRDVEMLAERRPCNKTYTRMVRVWKPNCRGPATQCLGFQRRSRQLVSLLKHLTYRIFQPRIFQSFFHPPPRSFPFSPLNATNMSKTLGDILCRKHRAKGPLESYFQKLLMHSNRRQSL